MSVTQNPTITLLSFFIITACIALMISFYCFGRLMIKDKVKYKTLFLATLSGIVIIFALEILKYRMLGFIINRVFILTQNLELLVPLIYTYDYAIKFWQIISLVFVVKLFYKISFIKSLVMVLLSLITTVIVTFVITLLFSDMEQVLLLFSTITLII